MKPYTNPLNAYKETKVRTASQGKLIVMLYDEALKQIDTALHELEKSSKQLDAVHNSIVKAQDIVTELTVSLDFEKGGEIAQNLFGLYMFFNRQLMESNVSKDPVPLKSVRKLLTGLREAWVQIAHTQVEGSTASTGVNIAGQAEMHTRELSAALEDRLSFYSELMEKMSAAIENEDTESVEYLSGLEGETTRIIVSLEKSLSVLRTTEKPQTGLDGQKDTLLLLERVARARSNAIAAANRNKLLLENHLEDIKARMRQSQKQPARKPFFLPDPAFIDLSI